jgi:NADH-quinone oxidoreductase subunit J
MSSSVDAIAFGVLAVLIVGGAGLMLASRNVVHAAFWMLETMLATAALYLLLSAEFLALVQIMVYAGAVAVLIIFTVMLTLRRREDAVRPRDVSVSALALAALFGALMYVAISRAAMVPTVPAPAAAPGIMALGTALFSTWVLPFELASVILLVGLVGAVWWALSPGDEPRPGRMLGSRDDEKGEVR